MLRIKMAENVPLDIAKMIQANHMICRDKYPERHPKRINSTVQIRHASTLGGTKFYHAWLHIPNSMYLGRLQRGLTQSIQAD